MLHSPLNIAVLLSGSGRTLQNLIDLKKAGKLDIHIQLVIASRAGLGGTQRAVDAGLPNNVIDRKSYSDLPPYSNAIFSAIDLAKVDLVVMAGWLSLIEIPSRYANRIINIHPSLLPAFGGKGMYGHKVHEAVVAGGCKISGCTAHFVDANYDTGPIILQRSCPVLDNDTADDLANRVFAEEKIALPAAIALYQQNRLRMNGRRVVITEK